MTDRAAQASCAAAERAFVQAKGDARAGLRRARVALGLSLSRPVALGLLAGASGLAGYWLARQRPGRARVPASVPSRRAAVTAAAGVVLAFLARHGLHSLYGLAWRAWTARHAVPARSGEQP